MGTGISVRSVALVSTGNPDNDAISADVTVDSTPSGALVLLASPTPDLSMAVACPFFEIGPGEAGGVVYRCRVAYPGLWYFFAQDELGTSLPAAGWPGLSGSLDMMLVGQQITAIMSANVPGIEAALKQVYFDGVSIKQVVFGTSSSITDFPSILVCKPTETAEWVAMPLVREHTYRLEIVVFIFHQDRLSLVSVGTQFAAAAMGVLNRQEYNTIMLPNGLCLAFCQAQSGDCDEVQIDETQWCAIGSIVWTGKALKQGGMA